MKNYIGMVILNANVDKGETEIIQSDIIRIFKRKTKLQEVWFLGRRKLDYQIRKHTHGIYLKIKFSAREKEIEKIKEYLKQNLYVIFSIIINNGEEEKKELPILKKCKFPFRKDKEIDALETNQSQKKVYMLISKNVRLPFSESSIVAISENEKKLYEHADRILQHYIFSKGYHTKKAFKIIKDATDELKRKWKIELTLNGNVERELLIQERELI